VITSYHNHSTWSDGRAEFPELVAAARDAELDELGISDHYTLFPDDHFEEWSMPPRDLDDYVAGIIGIAQTSRSPIIRLGLEVDFFPESVDRLCPILARYPFDYVIGSVHFLDSFPIDLSPAHWGSLGPEEVREKWALYWTRVGQLAASGICDFVGHLDLPKKFGFTMPDDLMPMALQALDAIAAADMAIEINTAGWHVVAGEAYPAAALLRAARERDIPLLVNADAHDAHNVARDLDRGRSLARECGYSSVVRYEARRRVPVPL
jgi:histidinol-phosphatase (PHP family)